MVFLWFSYGKTTNWSSPIGAWRNGLAIVEAWRNERVVFERPLGSSAPQMRGVAGPKIRDGGWFSGLFNRYDIP